MTEGTTTQGVGQVRVVEGIRWVQTDRTSNGQPIWKLDLPIGTYFVLKDYGRKSAIEAFRGVRLVSGGPFTLAGRWVTIEEAMVGIAPWLKERIRQKIAEERGKIADLDRALADTAEIVA